MLSQLLNRECTITRRVSTDTFDDDGEEVFDEIEVETVCELQQRRRDEPGDQGELSDTGWLGVFLAEVTLRTGDAVEVDGERYEVVGEPERFRNPRIGQFSHIEATLRRTAGAGDEVGS